MRLLIMTLLLASTVTLSSNVAKTALQSQASVSDGVYTDEQAARGRGVARDHCARCHATDWTGLEGPPLVGDTFLRQWGPRTLRRLFEKIDDTMPPGDPDSVSDAEALDVLAFLLQQNGLPAGDHELSPDAPVFVGTLPIARTARPAVGSLVQVFGCLQRAAGEWVLTGSNEPTFAVQDVGRLEETVPRGTTTVRLMNAFPVPTDKTGRAVIVQGFLVADTAPFVVNVVSLELAGPAC
jgi:mono/diheme cytochrome c family protein